MARSFLYLIVRRLVGMLLGRLRSQYAKDLEIAVLRHQLDVLCRQVKRPAFRPADRAVLAVLSRALAGAQWSAFLVTPGTILRWHRRLVTRAWTQSFRRGGRPLGDRGHRPASRGDRAPDDAVGPVQHRTWDAAGSPGRVSDHPSGAWVVQRARELSIQWEQETAAGTTVLRFLIRDRGSKFTCAFDGVFAWDDTKIIKAPVQAPNANGFAERWVRTVRAECLDWMLIWVGVSLSGCSTSTCGITTTSDRTEACSFARRAGSTSNPP